MKLGVITDGISRNFAHALQVMQEADLEYAELQFVWHKEVGDFDSDEIRKIKQLLNQYDRKVCCITRHVFAGLSVMQTQISDKDYQRHFDSLQRCIDTAYALNTKTVRVMSFKKEMILFGENGAEKWNAVNGAWGKYIELMKPVVELAEKNNITLVVETGNNAIIISTKLALKAIQELGSDHLKVLWDPANSLFCNEQAYPDGVDTLLQNNILGHFHIKDSIVDIAGARVIQCELGRGQLGPHLQAISDKLNQAQYDGVVSLESVYHPGDGNFEAGFKASLPTFKQIFG